MGVSSQMMGVPGDECQCGRRATIRHCPSCGSVRVYPRMNRPHKMLDGSTKWVETEFRCQGCGHLFIEEERELCEAPAVGQRLAAQRVRSLQEAKQSGQFLTRSEKKLLDAMNVLAKTPDALITDEQCDNLLRQAYPEAVFAFKDGKGPNPGTVDEFLATFREDVRAKLIEAQRQGISQ